MKHSISPLAVTVIFAAAAAALLAAVTNLPPGRIYRTTAANAAIFLCLAAYALFLARSSRKSLRVLFAPLLILTSVLVTADSVSAFGVPAAAGLAWVRSGGCFPGPIARRLCTEALLGPVGLTLAWLLQPPGPYGWALGIWLFGLIQAFYFILIDIEQTHLPGEKGQDGFSQNHHRAEALIREQKLARAFQELGL